MQVLFFNENLIKQIKIKLNISNPPLPKEKYSKSHLKCSGFVFVSKASYFCSKGERTKTKDSFVPLYKVSKGLSKDKFWSQ